MGKSIITMTTTALDSEFPCSLTIDLPLPTARLASIALKTLIVDAELSPLVRRSFSTITPSTASAANGPSDVAKGEESVLSSEWVHGKLECCAGDYGGVGCGCICGRAGEEKIVKDTRSAEGRLKL